MWFFYYAVWIFATVGACFLFPICIRLSLASVEVLFSMAIIVLMTYLFREDGEERWNLKYSLSQPRLFDSEYRAMNFSMAKVALLLTPVNFPLVFFFSDWVKIIGSLLIVVLTMVIGGLLFKRKCGKQIRARTRREQQELEEQKKKEESGHF